MTGPRDFRRYEPAASERHAAIRFLVKLARGLHMYGTPAQNIELALEVATRRLGLPSQFFALPTVILAAFGTVYERSTGLIRVEPGSVQLEKLVLLDDVMKDLLKGDVSPAEGVARVDAIEARPPPYGPLTTIVAYAIASACAARFFNGGARECLFALLVGAVPGVIGLLSGLRAGLARVNVPLSAFLVSFMALALGAWCGGFSTYLVTVSSLIVLLPGLSLTMAMSELAAQSLVSGAVRIVTSGVVFLELGFGVALGRALGTFLIASEAVGEPPQLPKWTEYAALLVAPLAYAVLFRARRRDMPVILFAGVLGFLGARAGSRWISPDLGVFLGALVVALASNLIARRINRPVAVTLLPGILLLVPGSIGFRSVFQLLDRDVLSGIEGVFHMTLAAAAIVAGLLFANVAVPARRPF